MSNNTFTFGDLMNLSDSLWPQISTNARSTNNAETNVVQSLHRMGEALERLGNQVVIAAEWFIEDDEPNEQVAVNWKQEGF